MDGPVVSIDDYERIAKAKLPAEVYDYFAGGSGEEWSLRANIAAFKRWVIRPRVLVGVEERDTTSDLLGTRVSFPVLVAPWAFQHMADPEGDVATARGAARAGTIMVLSATASHRSQMRRRRLTLRSGFSCTCTETGGSRRTCFGMPTNWGSPPWCSLSTFPC